MSIAQVMLAEFQQEAVKTRRFLERVPEDKMGWAPHPKSMPLGKLAYHIAEAPGLIVELILKEVASPTGRAGVHQAATVAELLAALDAGMARVAELLPQVDDAMMAETWRLEIGGRTALEMPRAAAFRAMLLNHIYHHRGQLSVYLRLLDVPVPSAYGPTADEPPAFLRDAQP